jgi:hypothetical protein
MAHLEKWNSRSRLSAQTTVGDSTRQAGLGESQRRCAGIGESEPSHSTQLVTDGGMGKEDEALFFCINLAPIEITAECGPPRLGRSE